MPETTPHKHITEERLDQLNESKVKTMDVIFALARGRAEAIDMIQHHLGESTIFPQTPELYEAGMGELRKRQDGGQTKMTTETMLANMTQALLLSNLGKVLRVDGDELNTICDAVMHIEIEDALDKKIEKQGGTKH